ncbi:hypothetical protein ACF3NF_05655 [Anaerococcus martiniensis]
MVERVLYLEYSPTDLYDELTIPVELRKTYQKNDKTIMEAMVSIGGL